MKINKFLSFVLLFFVVAASATVFAMDNRKRQCPPTPRKQRPAKRARIIANLFDAAKEGDVPLVKKFLEAGENVNMVVEQGPNKGKTPLLVAVKMGHVDVVKLLLLFGADQDYIVTEGIDTGTTAMYWAKTRGNQEIIDLLVSTQHRNTLIIRK